LFNKFAYFPYFKDKSTLLHVGMSHQNTINQVSFHFIDIIDTMKMEKTLDKNQSNQWRACCPKSRWRTLTFKIGPVIVYLALYFSVLIQELSWPLL